ncbi:lipopolysaccharide biosynthesis protein [Specibacter sp. RAF43]|uniref:lipopolysaccharide biosynthesis protein n=1 Tax=Specibacter sp. RAF43 TaxID=3233057 RepID=UPI003F9D6644
MSLRDKAAAGVLWTTAQKWAVRLSGFVTIAVLSRLLVPADFGVIAVATAVMPLLYLLADLGFSTYVVQAERVDQRILSTAFWYSTLAGGLLAGVLVLIAPFIGAIFRLADVVPVLYALAPVVMLVALASVPMAVLKRRLAFRALAVQSMVASVVGQVVAVALALAGMGVWALVWQLLVVQAITLGWAWAASAWRPTAQFDRREFVAMTRFGGNVVGTEVIALSRLWAETAIVSVALGPAGLGFLNIAQRLIQVAQDLTASAIVPVSTVVFARIRSDVGRLGSGYLRASELTYAAIVPVMVFVSVAAAQIVPLVFGGQWSESVLPAQLLAVAGILTIGASVDQGLFYGAGRPGRWFAYATAIDALTVAATVLLVRFGLPGICVGFIAVAFLATIVRWVLTARIVHLPLAVVALPFWRMALAGMLSAALGMVVVVALESTAVPTIVVVAVTGLAVAGPYVALVRLVAPRTFAEVLALIRQRLPLRSRHQPQPTEVIA